MKVFKGFYVQIRQGRFSLSYVMPLWFRTGVLHRADPRTFPVHSDKPETPMAFSSSAAGKLFCMIRFRHGWAHCFRCSQRFHILLYWAWLLNQSQGGYFGRYLGALGLFLSLYCYDSIKSNPGTFKQSISMSTQRVANINQHAVDIFYWNNSNSSYQQLCILY